MVTYLGLMAHDHALDGGTPWDRLGNFDHFWEGDLPRDGDHPKNGDHHRDGGHPRVLDFHQK